jgi:hypothetical protein
MPRGAGGAYAQSMRTRTTVPWAVGLTASVLLAGCGAPRASLPPGAMAVRTDDSLVSAARSGGLCTGTSVPPFVVVLEGDPSDRAWPVWLRAEDGRRIYIVWPAGFSVRFDPDAILLDETGAPILHAGSPLRFEQGAPGPSDGTGDRPYVAAGGWDTGLAEAPHCYIYNQ